MASAYTSSSDFKKIILLEDWWLIQAVNDVKGKRLAVAGFSYRDTNQARRLFSSAPILKIHDVFTLETIDGIYVVLRGFINKAHTLKNGFAAEILDHFIFGFPPHWKACGEKWMIEGYTANTLSRNSGKEDEGVEGFEIPKEPEVNLEAGISTVDLQETNRNSESVETTGSPENFLDDILTQPIADLSTGPIESAEVSALLSKTTNKSITAEKSEPVRTSRRKSNLKTLRGNTKDDTDDYNRHMKFSEEDNKALEVTVNLKNKSPNYPEKISSDFSPRLLRPKRPKSGLTTWVSGLDEQGVAPSIEATNINIGAEKVKSNSRKSQRKLKFSSCSGHTEDNNDECNSDVNLNTVENQRLEVGTSALDKQGDTPSSEATNIDLGAEKDKCNRRKSQRKLRSKSCSSQTEENNDESNSDVNLNNAEEEVVRINRNGRESSTILSPESLSSKRSRSGRLLLPTLEFWRNQTVIYDADGHVSGVMQELPAIRPSQVGTPTSVTAPSMKGKEKRGRSRKYLPEKKRGRSRKYLTEKKRGRSRKVPA